MSRNIRAELNIGTGNLAQIFTGIGEQLRAATTSSSGFEVTATLANASAFNADIDTLRNNLQTLRADGVIPVHLQGMELMVDRLNTGHQSMGRLLAEAQRLAGLPRVELMTDENLAFVQSLNRELTNQQDVIDKARERAVEYLDHLRQLGVEMATPGTTFFTDLATQATNAASTLATAAGAITGAMGATGATAAGAATHAETMANALGTAITQFGAGAISAADLQTSLNDFTTSAQQSITELETLKRTATGSELSQIQAQIDAITQSTDTFQKRVQEVAGFSTLHANAQTTVDSFDKVQP